MCFRMKVLSASASEKGGATTPTLSYAEPLVETGWESISATLHRCSTLFAGFDLRIRDRVSTKEDDAWGG